MKETIKTTVLKLTQERERIETIVSFFYVLKLWLNYWLITNARELRSWLLLLPFQF